MEFRPYHVARSLIVVPLLLITISACSDSDSGLTSTSGSEPESAKSKFETLMDSLVAEPNVVNTMVSVSDGTPEGSFTVARGEAAPGIPMTSEHQFHIASMTKPFTATVLMQLVEEDYFELETPLSALFSDLTMATLFPNHNFSSVNPDGLAVADMTIDQLQTFGGQLLGGNITIKQLMQHAHGMPDLTFDAPLADESLITYMVAKNVGSTDLNSDKYPTQWSGLQLLEYYLASGLPNQSLFAPGEGFHYGDTGPTIAGLIIESATGMSLEEVFRARIFDPLGMDDTYLNHYEEPRQSLSAGVAHRYYDLSDAYPSLGNVDVQADNWNTSIAWAGGGLVSTASDLEKFNRALFEGQLLQDISVIGALENRMEESDEDSPHGLGFYTDVSTDGNTILSYRHGGFWGSEMIYFPKSGITVSYTNNQVEASSEAFYNLVDSLYLK